MSNEESRYTKKDVIQHLENLRYFFCKEALEIAISELKKPTTKETLNKIREEIIDIYGSLECAEESGCMYHLLEIIDKYRGMESEGKK